MALTIALAVEDEALASRLRAALAGAPGIALVAADAPADAVLRAARPRDAQPLSPRETEVLGLLAEGASNKEIARALGISQHTVKFHVRALSAKLDASGRTDAVAHAARLGVLHL
jgi:DNA-binding CsgD family transcriptional regulator